MPTETPPISTADLAAQLGVDPRTLHRWVASGEAVAAFKAPGLRGAYFFDADEAARLRELHAATP